MLTLLLMMTAQAASPIAIALTDADPEPGESLVMEVRWKNIYTQPVQIPANWTDEVKMWAWREPPGQRPSANRQAQAVQPQFLSAREVEWLTLEPGQMVTHQLPLDIDACKGGCIGGSYYGQINLNWGKSIQVDDLAKTQLLPSGQIPFNFDVRMPTDVVEAATGLAAELVSVNPPADGSLTGTVRLTNISGGAIWAANADHWAVGCTLMDKKGVPAGMIAAQGADAPATEDAHQLLAAGDSIEVPVTCEGIVSDGLPKKATLNVALEPTVSFFPIKAHEDRSVVTGNIASSESYRVPKK
ncbi:MAG: hypothetical protein AAFV53_04240 [Myxococcota bacterium]